MGESSANHKGRAVRPTDGKIEMHNQRNGLRQAKIKFVRCEWSQQKLNLCLSVDAMSEMEH
jgi:hypothetical protein